MSSDPSPFCWPQAMAPLGNVTGFTTKPVTSTPSILAVAESKTRETFAGKVSTTLVSKAVESPPLGMVTAYSRTSPTVAGSLGVLSAGETKLTDLVAVKSGSATAISTVLPAPPDLTVASLPLIRL